MESGSSFIDQSSFIRDQILRAIALNRTPGYHFCGNFLDLWFEDVYDGKSRITIKAAPHVLGSDGNMPPVTLAVAADFAAASAVRTADDPAIRLATVSLHLQLTGQPMTGDLIAKGTLDGFFPSAQGKLGLARITVVSNDQLVAFGTSTFMVLPPPGGKKLFPIPWVNNRPPEIERPRLEELSNDELQIVERAEKALKLSHDNGMAFIEAFLDIQSTSSDGLVISTMANGPHINNRVGHVQGGVSLGMAMVSANSALPKDWAIVGITASYVSPGEGETLTARSEIIHKGRMTAVVSTKLMGSGRLVLEVTTNHVKLKG